MYWEPEPDIKSNEEPSQQREILRYFEYDHLPDNLQSVSEPFWHMAHWIEKTLPSCAEKSVALRKLLESKDAAVRAALPKE